MVVTTGFEIKLERNVGVIWCTEFKIFLDNTDRVNTKFNIPPVFDPPKSSFPSQSPGSMRFKRDKMGSASTYPYVTRLVDGKTTKPIFTLA